MNQPTDRVLVRLSDTDDTYILACGHTAHQTHHPGVDQPFIPSHWCSMCQVWSKATGRARGRGERLIWQ